MLTRPAAAARRGVGGGLGAGRARVRVIEVVTAHGEDLIQSDVVMMMLPRHDALEAVVVAEQEGGPHLVQYSTVKYSSTVQYSTVQQYSSTVQATTLYCQSLCPGPQAVITPPAPPCPRWLSWLSTKTTACMPSAMPQL